MKLAVEALLVIYLFHLGSELKQGTLGTLAREAQLETKCPSR
jgi:hypothetical protein